MTDKQIIIDGVDVSGCSYHYNGWSQLYRDTRDMCDTGYDLECKPKENGCYHYTKCLEEQLKAKEQECERLKNLFEGVRKSLEVEIEECSKWSQLETEARFKLVKTQQQLDQLKAENDELEKELRQKKMTILMNNDHYFEVDQENKKLKQTLTEIKEIAEDFYLDGEHVKDKYLAQEILQKISEVEDG